LWGAQGSQIGEWRIESRFYVEPIRAHLAKMTRKTAAELPKAAALNC